MGEKLRLILNRLKVRFARADMLRLAQGYFGWLRFVFVVYEAGVCGSSCDLPVCSIRIRVIF